jgi:AcrR family transcriptional regulator
MARKYQLKRRAERQDETRQRIVQAAVALHTSVGPTRTSISAIADRAGVQRHTFYRHFPDERSLALACSGHFDAEHPLPDPDKWRAIADPEQRLRTGLGELYRYFERNASMIAPIVRDIDVDPMTREVFTLRIGSRVRQMQSILSEGFQLKGPVRRRLTGALETFLNFATWRTLRAAMPSHAETVEAAARAVAAQCASG